MFRFPNGGVYLKPSLHRLPCCALPSQGVSEDSFTPTYAQAALWVCYGASPWPYPINAFEANLSRSLADARAALAAWRRPTLAARLSITPKLTTRRTVHGRGALQANS